MRFNKREKQILNDHMTQGYIDFKDFNHYWSSASTRKEKSDHFFTLGIVKHSTTWGRLTIIKENIDPKDLE